MDEFLELSKVLEKKDIKLLGDFKFNSKTDEILFLNKLEEILSKNIKFNSLNSDLIRILTDVELTEKNILILRQINWRDYFENFKEKDKNDRTKRIYFNFLNFLKTELQIEKFEKPLIDKKLIEIDKKEKFEFLIDEEILIKRNDFNIKEDLKNKIKKFDIKVLFDYNEPSGKIKVNDFTLYFNRRLQYFTNLLKGRFNAENIQRIGNLVDLYESNEIVTIIGLISEITQTKNGHYIITLEDRSSQIKCFINKDKTSMIKQIEKFCLDEGIGVVGKVGKEIIWVDEFIIPSPVNSTILKTTEKEHYVAFLSDIHFGAKVFQDEAFQKMLDFFNGRTNNEKLNEISKKINHIIIAGDIIEGIGIYPGQGEDARILSTEGQYKEAARWLSQIPKDKSIIIIPGNHDTSRLSEPQIKLSYDKSYALYNMENVVMFSNPASINLFNDDKFGGLNFYIYHGGSIFYYSDKIKELREKGGAKVPEEVIKFLLEKRHIAPSHGSTLYIPDSKNDPLVINKMPDFFVTGHTHKLSLANYKGCSIISCGCWVEMSDYQEKMGMFPDIGKLTIVNTKTRKPQILNFYTELHKRN